MNKINGSICINADNVSKLGEKVYRITGHGSGQKLIQEKPKYLNHCGKINRSAYTQKWNYRNEAKFLIPQHPFPSCWTGIKIWQLRPISLAYFLKGHDFFSAWRELELFPMRVQLEMLIYTPLNLLCLMSTLFSISIYSISNAAASLATEI